MRILQFILLLAAAVVWLPGCAPPEAEFVYSGKTEGLAPEVGDEVKARVVENFGAPAHPVAWLRMPVDFGTLPGRVVEPADEKSAAYRFKAVFETAEDEAEAAPDLDELNLSGLAIRWTSGRYAQGAQIAGGRRDGELMGALHVASWDREAGILTLRQNMDPPPAAGDTFEIIGHKLSAGRQLYAAHCQHCHGVSGDGQGTTAPYLYPLPRDYRLGKFKFQSTQKTDRPTDEDLERIIRLGIPGTYMPSFLLLEDDELDAMVQYVKFLSMRGEYELKLDNRLFFTYEEVLFQRTVQGELKSALEAFDLSSGADRPTERSVREALLYADDAELSELPEISEQESSVLADAWTQVTVIVPSVARVPDSPQSRANGRVLYIKNCAACHGATGRGDGEQADEYMVNEETRERYPEPGLFDDWGEPIKPRDLTRGIYRGGRRPVDLYRRMYEGINGTPMPPFKGKVPDAEIWDIVNYVYSIPFADRGEPQTPSAAETPRTAATENVQQQEKLQQ